MRNTPPVDKFEAFMKINNICNNVLARASSGAELTDLEVNRMNMQLTISQMYLDAAVNNAKKLTEFSAN